MKRVDYDGKKVDCTQCRCGAHYLLNVFVAYFGQGSLFSAPISCSLG